MTIKELIDDINLALEQGLSMDSEVLFAPAGTQELVDVAEALLIKGTTDVDPPILMIQGWGW